MNHQAEIIKIDLQHSRGNIVDLCKFGDDIQISFEVKFNKVVENPIFGIRITDHRNNIVYGTNNRLNGVKSDTYQPGDKLRVVFRQAVNLIGGTYYVSP